MRSSILDAKSLLLAIVSMPAHEFWPDDVSCVDLPERGIVGHRQVTDAYLVALAAAHEGVVATMDEALATVHSRHAILI